MIGKILQIFDKIRLLLSGQHFPLSASLDLRFSDFWSLTLMIHALVSLWLWVDVSQSDHL